MFLRLTEPDGHPHRPSGGSNAAHDDCYVFKRMLAEKRISKTLQAVVTTSRPVPPAIAQSSKH